MKKLIIPILLILGGCTGSTWKTAHFSFDGNTACLNDTVMATVDTGSVITHINSPEFSITLEKIDSVTTRTIIHGCININK